MKERHNEFNDQITDDATNEAGDQTGIPVGAVKATKTNAPITGDFTERRKINVPHSQDHHDELVDLLLAAMTQVEELIDEKSEANATMNAKIKTIKSEVDSLHERLRRGYDVVEKEVRIVRNFEAGCREIYCDGKLIETEPLTAGDHQLDMADAMSTNAARNEDDGLFPESRDEEE